MERERERERDRTSIGGVIGLITALLLRWASDMGMERERERNRKEERRKKQRENGEWRWQRSEREKCDLLGFFEMNGRDEIKK